MENAIYMELLRRGCEVDVGVLEVVEYEERKQVHKRIEVDFVVNRCSRRICPSVSDVPDDATTFSTPLWCMEMTSV